MKQKEVLGSGNSMGTTKILVANSKGEEIFKVKDDTITINLNKMESKHTKGTWEVNPRASRHVRCNEITIASCSSGQSGDREEEEIANAKLIAAAPDLLKALVFARCFCIAKGINVESHNFKIIEEAIEKATK